ncbi:MAG TPA: hypothetical protein VFY90_11370 [Tepidiformaceae bacterium]|nr:hypothetical protein [Tepidiformaceae bacterium]
MAGYSGTPLPRKLGIKEFARVSLVQPPDGFAERALSPLPPGVSFLDHGREVDVLVLFVEWLEDLRARFGAESRRLKPNGGLWVAWPKKASKRPTDLDESVVREVGLAAGLVDNKVCAIDETWSGLRFVYRVDDRPRP